MKKFLAAVPLVALLVTAAPMTNATSSMLADDVSDLYQRYPQHTIEVNEALEAGQDYINYSSRSWDAMVEAEAAQEAADLASQVAKEAEVEYEAATQRAAEAQAYADEKEEEARSSAQQALNAYNHMKRNQIAGGILPPAVTAMTMGADSLEDYQRSARHMGRVQDTTSAIATEAEEAREAADAALEEAEAARASAEDSARQAQVAQESADKSKKEAEEKREEAETLLGAAESRQNTASVTLASLDATSPAPKNEVPGVEVARKHVVTDWWEKNKEAETSKPRGSEAVAEKVEKIEEEVEKGAESPVATSSRAAATTSRSADRAPINEAVEGVKREAEKQKEVVKDAKKPGIARAERAVSLLGTPSDEMKCTAFIAGFYDSADGTLADMSVLAQRYEVKDAIPGDIIYYEAPDGSISQAGVYIGGGTAVVSSDPAGVVTSESALTGSFASRPGVAPAEKYKKPETSSRWECGGISRRNASANVTWALPFDEYELGKKFQRGDFEALEFIRKGEETAVYAPHQGVVSVLEGGTVQIASESTSMTIRGLDPENIIAKTGAKAERGEAIATGDKITIQASIAGERINPEVLFFPSWGGGDMSKASGENQFGKPKFKDVPPSISEATLPVVMGGAVRQTSGWGPREAPVPGADTFHRGVDFGGPVGTPIMSVLDGVVWATFSDKYSGNQVIVQYRVDGRDYAVIYKHMSSAHDAYVQEGDLVKAGDVIGEIGSTGQFSSGPHLHFEVWESVFNRDHHVNASDWLTMIGAW